MNSVIFVHKVRVYLLKRQVQVVLFLVRGGGASDNFGEISSVDHNFSSNHPILFSDPRNENYGSGGSNAPLKSRIASVVAEIFHDTF